MKATKLFFALGMMLLSSYTNGQDTATLKSGQGHGMNPSGFHDLDAPIASLDEIILSNYNKGDLTVYLSDDNKTWEKTKLGANTEIKYKTSKKHIKIYGTHADSCYYTLVKGNAYKVFWNKSKNIWDVKK